MRMYVRGYKGAGAGSSFIKWWTRSSYSHVSFVFDIRGEVKEVEAIQGKGVISHPPYTSEEKVFVELEVPVPEEQIIEASALADSLVGADYDWKFIVGFIGRRRIHSLDKWGCSELVSYVCLKASHPLNRREPYMNSPDDVMASYRIG